MKNILITGGHGQLGIAFFKMQAKFPDYNFIFTSRESLDITKPTEIQKLFEKINFYACINCAAYTAVDKAEQEECRAITVNVDAVAYLAAACKAHATRLIHYSSDYVYHNSQNSPLKETDPTLPAGVYAKTKLEGEQKALDSGAQVTIIRTSWVYGADGHNFLNTMLRLGQEKPSLSIVYDQIGAPTWTHDIVNATMHLISFANSPHQEKLNGIFNFSNEGVCSWYDFAHAIFEFKHMDCKVIPILSREYPTPASRPNFSLLDKNKIKSTFGLKIPHWREALKYCLSNEAI